MSTPKVIAGQLMALAGERLEPRRYARRTPLEVGVWQCGTPAPLADAVRATYSPAPPGWRWGPVWSSAWFRLRTPGPAEAGDGPMWLRFSCGTEATVWASEQGAAVPVHGLDVNHVLLPPAVWRQASRSIGSGGGREMYIEAACNRPLGATTFFWDDASEVARWEQERPGRLEFAELVERDEPWDTLTRRVRFAAGAVGLLDETDSAPLKAARLVAAAMENGAPRDELHDALHRLLDTMPSGPPARSVCRSIGHAHIDTAWLWTLEQTRRKCLRTFSTALALLDANPEFRFLCTQPRLYAWVEHDSPALFQRIASRVRDGRWEVGAGVHQSGASGAMWIEPDCNLPSGESLIRQVLLGTRYVRARFGATSSHPYVFLPDTFGFPGSMPQILAGCGVRTFIFNKLWWNETNPPATSAFRWRGIDGTEVVSYLTPGMEYNATMTPAELRTGDANHRAKDPTAPSEWLQPFGYGDGGGGPTQEMIDAAALAKLVPMLPLVRPTRVDEFCERLHERRDALRRGGADLPLWPEPELYLERHRGTYTTQAWLKRANRRAEESLRLAEALTFAGPRTPSDEQATEARRDLDPAWELLLLNQFHDILPGSSVTSVYDEARGHFETIDAATGRVIERASRRWAPAIAPSPDAPADASRVLVLNPASEPRSGVIEMDGQPRYVRDVPALGVRAVTPTPGSESIAPHPTAAIELDGGAFRLANGLIELTVNADGTIAALATLVSLASPASPAALDTRRSLRGPLNILALYEDSPKYWEAWDIESDYRERPVPLPAPESVGIDSRHPLRSAVRVSRRVGERSRLTQRITLDAGSTRVDIRTCVDWRERRMLLRVLFPTGIVAPQATYDIQFGHIRRSTSLADPIGAARFEVCAHRWMDLSGISAPEDGGRPIGLALLNDCKYGHSCHADVMGLTLLRAPIFPDQAADQGPHEFTYSLVPHAGDWRAANVDGEADNLNQPLRVLSDRMPGGAGDAPPAWSPFTLDASRCGGRIEIAAIKPAEDGDGLVVRLVETRGVGGDATITWKIRPGSVSFVDLVERPLEHDAALRHDAAAGQTHLAVRPFQIVSLRVRREQEPAGPSTSEQSIPSTHTAREVAGRAAWTQSPDSGSHGMHVTGAVKKQVRKSK